MYVPRKHNNDITDYEIQRYAFPHTHTHAIYELKYARYGLPKVCVHAYCVLELLMACHVRPKGTYITDYDIQGYAFPPMSCPLYEDS